MDFITTLFSDTVLYALGWTVIHSLWQGTLLAILLAVLMMTLEKRSAKLRYEVACGAMFTMLMMSVATFIIYLEHDSNLIEITIAMIGESTNPSVTITNEEVGFLQANFQMAVAFFDKQLPLIVNIWLIGFLFFAFKMAGGFIHLRQLRHQDNFPVDAFLQNKLDQLIRRASIKKSVQVMESALVKVPVLMGHLKPLILIPIGTINLLTEEEVEAILAHELAHILRSDFSMNLFFTFIETLFYYHPGVWLMAATVRSERENCCDDLALLLCKNPLAYARALYKLEAAHKAARLPGLALSFSGQKKQLLHRVRRILNQPQNKSNIMEKFITTSFLLLTITILSVGATTRLDNLEARRIISTGVETLSHPVVYVASDRLPNLNIRPQIILLDTIPIKIQDRQKIIKTENGRAIEITTEDGEISNLKIDGKEIPAHEYDQHENLINEIVNEFAKIPTPPTPPNMTTEDPRAVKEYIIDKVNERLVTVYDDNDDSNLVNKNTEIFVDTVNNRVVTIYGNDTETTIDTDQEIIIRDIEKNMEIHHQNMEKQHKDMEKQHKDMEEHHKKMQQQREVMKKNHAIRMEAQLAKMEEHRKKMETRRQEMKTQRAAMKEMNKNNDNSSNQIIAENIGRADDQINAAIETQLLADGLIDSKENYQFELTGKKLKVNRKNQSAALHQKYKTLYGELSGTPLSDKSKLKVKKSKN